MKTARDLTNLFCCNDLILGNSAKQSKVTKNSDILASRLHTETIAEFVNREVLAYHRT